MSDQTNYWNGDAYLGRRVRLFLEPLNKRKDGRERSAEESIIEGTVTVVGVETLRDGLRVLIYGIDDPKGRCAYRLHRGRRFELMEEK
jgi:hypothetical protein